jgi:DNA-binding MarR family transcriptional regulator
VGQAARLLLEVSDRLREHHTRLAMELGMSGNEAKVLLAVRPDQGTSMRVLAKLLGFDASNLTGLVDRLEGRRLVERQAEASDRRIKTVVLTDAGARTRETFLARLSADAGPLKTLTQTQVEQLLDLLGEVAHGGVEQL